jgi:hypothetical protein
MQEYNLKEESVATDTVYETIDKNQNMIRIAKYTLAAFVGIFLTMFVFGWLFTFTMNPAEVNNNQNLQIMEKSI